MKTVLIFALVAAVLAGCGGDGSGTAADSPVNVAASFFPLAEAARQVGGDRVDVTDLTPPGVEPHDLELGFDDVDAVLDADLAIVMGEGFQPSVEDAAADREGPTIEVLDGIDSDDPHVWLDPTKLADIVADIADGLAAFDPGGASIYTGNARAYRARLVELDADVKAGLLHCERREIVTAHESFGWLTARYGLTQHAIAGVSPDQEPDPQRIAELEDLVRRDGVTTIFTEELVSPEVADALARQAGVSTAVLDPLEAKPAQDDYVSAMRANLTILQEALSCT